MRIIAFSKLRDFGMSHPLARPALERWYSVAKAATWQTMNDIQTAFPKAKVLNHERVRFEVAGGRFRLIVAFDFPNQIAFIKFLGTHAEYDAIDALTVAQF